MKNNNVPREWRGWALEMKRKGVVLRAILSNVWLECAWCGESWSPNTPPAGKKMARGYWQCPNGCNAKGSGK